MKNESNEQCNIPVNIYDCNMYYPNHGLGNETCEYVRPAHSLPIIYFYFHFDNPFIFNFCKTYEKYDRHFKLCACLCATWITVKIIFRDTILLTLTFIFLIMPNSTKIKTIVFGSILNYNHLPSYEQATRTISNYHGLTNHNMDGHSLLVLGGILSVLSIHVLVFKYTTTYKGYHTKKNAQLRKQKKSSNKTANNPQLLLQGNTKRRPPGYTNPRRKGNSVPR